MSFLTIKNKEYQNSYNKREQLTNNVFAELMMQILSISSAEYDTFHDYKSNYYLNSRLEYFRQTDYPYSEFKNDTLFSSSGSLVISYRSFEKSIKTKDKL